MKSKLGKVCLSTSSAFTFRDWEGTLVESGGEECFVYDSFICESEFKDYFNGYFTACLKSKKSSSDYY